MSILDTFYILFKANAKETAAEVASVGVAGDEAAVGLTAADAAAAKLGASFVTMAKGLAAPLLALISVGSLTQIAMDRAKAIGDLDKAATKLNSSIGDVDAFQRSIKAAGGTTEGAISGLQALGDKINEAFSDKKSGARKDLHEWGVSIKGIHGQAIGAVEGMLRLAKSLEGVSRAEALARIKKLGINDEETIQLLLKGRRAVQEKMDAEKAAGVVTEEQARIAREYQGELGKTGNMLTSMGNKIEEYITPALTSVIAAFRTTIEWMGKNRWLVEGFFIGVSGIITTVYLPAITEAAIATIAATWPFLAVAAAVAAVGAAFALAYDDVRAFLRGQPSVIGELAKKYWWFADIIKGIGWVFSEIKATIVADINAIIAAWDLLVAGFNIGWTAIKPWLEALGDASVSVADKFVSFFHTLDPLWTALGAAARLAGDVVKVVFDGILTTISNLATAWAPYLEAARNVITEAFEWAWNKAKPIFDKIAGAAQVIQAAFTAAFDVITSAWDNTIGRLARGIDSFVNKARSLLGLGSDATVDGKEHAFRDRLMNRPGARQSNNIEDERAEGNLLPDIKEQLKKGKAAIDNTKASPFASQSPQAIRAAAANNNSKTDIKNTNTVNVGGVVINAPGADADEIANHVEGALAKKFQQTQSHFDDGVSH